MDTLRNILDSLHEYEKKLLSSLSQETTVKEAAEITKLNEIEIMRGAQWLSNKKAIIINEKKQNIVSLTARGKETVKKGLPEVRLLEALKKKNNQSFNDLQKNAGLDKQEFNKALGFSRKQGLVAILKGKIKIISLGTDYLKKEEKKQKLLSLLSKQSVEKNKLKKYSKELKILTDRALIKVEEKKTRYLSTTPLGIKLLKRGVNLKEKLLERVTTKLIKSKEWRKTKFRRYNVVEPVPKKNYGKKQPYVEFINQIKLKLVGMGFQEMTGPSIETNFFNCDALYMPQDHPARGVHDIFFIKEPEKDKLKGYDKFIKKIKKAHEKGCKGSTGWKVPFSKDVTKKHVLRSQGTAISARMLMNKNLKIPGKYFAIGRCYRPDVIDKTHLPEFNQLEGIILGEDLNLKTLFGLLRMFAEKIAGIKKFKLMPDYYPFTEPSVSLHGYFGGKWIEMGGAGIFRPEITESLGIKVPVIAWGLGFARMFMSAQNISDIREMFSSDINWLRSSKVM